jgi:hypothetical protein
MVNWGRDYGATTPSHLGLYGTGPLCSAFSSARHLQRRSTSSDMRDLCYWKTELGEKWPVNLACDSDFHVNRKVLLDAANLRHGTDGFTSPPKECILWIFSPEKSDGFSRVRTELYLTVLYRTLLDVVEITTPVHWLVPILYSIQGVPGEMCHTSGECPLC